MAGIDRHRGPTRVLDGSWRRYDGPSVVVGAPDPEAFDWSEAELFLDGPRCHDVVRVFGCYPEGQTWPECLKADRTVAPT